MNNKLVIAIRILLTFLIIFGVYNETGVVTAMAMSLIFVSIEFIGIAIKEMTLAIKEQS